MFQHFSRLSAVAAGAAALAAATFGATQPASAEEIVARLSYHWAPAHQSAIFAEEFAKRVNERGAGKIRIDTFPSGQLFGIREIMGALSSGAVELGGVVGVVSFPPVDKNYNVEALPGTFKSFEQLRRFFNDDETGNKIWTGLLKRTRTQLIGYNPTGPYMTFSAARPLTTPEAFKDLKARYLAGIERPRWSALGADAVSMPTREVYTALQNGMIDTLNTVPSAIKAYSWWEYLKYGQLPFLFHADAFTLANQTWYDQLPDDVKQILQEVGAEISAESTKSIMEFSTQVLEEFEARGGQVDTLTDEQLAAFTEIDEGKVIPELGDFVDADVIAAAKAFVAKDAAKD
ncbi:TRAP transporter substrate-binding protein [Pikeienuella sp. HZG-20]|uniref:TRAP transporter substrate-binding protein n=1 Tax=Paludibacillus litoralis TaxID=3133267 RepID=UPI0030EE1F0F